MPPATNDSMDLNRICGVGSMRCGGSSFYTEVAQTAAAAGISVNVLTMEGEDCSLEAVNGALQFSCNETDSEGGCAAASGTPPILWQVPRARGEERLHRVHVRVAVQVIAHCTAIWSGA